MLLCLVAQFLGLPADLCQDLEVLAAFFPTATSFGVFLI